jgi:hypothetical protein
MGRSKKGRLSGGARKELNEKRAVEAINGATEGITFARVSRMVGAGHVRVLIPCRGGSKEVLARIPNLLARRGSTPITTKDVVAIFVGPEYDPNAPHSGNTEHFDVTAILTAKQVYRLIKDGVIPAWMQDAEAEGGEKATGIAADGGFEFDYSGAKPAEEDESSESETETAVAVPAFQRKGVGRAAPAKASSDDEVDIDNI